MFPIPNSKLLLIGRLGVGFWNSNFESRVEFTYNLSSYPHGLVIYHLASALGEKIASLLLVVDDKMMIGDGGC